MKKKHLGQHFLHDPKLLKKIVDHAPVTPGDIVVEIGPGDGALTRAILDHGCRVVAVEYDTDLIPGLSTRFSAEISVGLLTLVQGDFLEMSIQELVPTGEQYHVIANIPYYITGAILRKLLSGDLQPLSCSLIMQREVAERIVCRDGKHSLLSLSVSVYGTCSIAFRILAGAFNPPPNVDSALLIVSNISRERFVHPGIDSDLLEKMFFSLIHSGFAQRRKQLYKLVADIVPIDTFNDWCGRFGYPATIRAEDVSIDAWIGLSLCIAK